MSVKVLMPKLGLTMTEGLIAKWLVSDGTSVVSGKPIFAVETDKATQEIMSPAEGILHILIKEGNSVPTGQLIATIQLLNESIASTSDLPSEPVSEFIASPAAKRRAAELQVDIHLLKGTGSGGRITEHDVEEYASRTETPISVDKRPFNVSPVARRRAEEAGIDLSVVNGSGSGGRIVMEDVEKVIDQNISSSNSDYPATTGRVIPLNGVRALIAKRMIESTQQTARVTLMTELDATELVIMRTALKPGLERQGIPLIYESLFTIIVAKALGEFPFMNARQVGEEIQLLDEINIGVAVDTDRGLLVPVLRDANRKTLLNVAQNLNKLIQRAISGSCTPEDLGGSTFTLTNLGMFGVDAFTPIINSPELAILGIGCIVRRPAEFDGQIVLRQRMTLSLSFDHRLVDGAPAARFLQRVKQICETPYLFLDSAGSV